MYYNLDGFEIRKRLTGVGDYRGVTSVCTEYTFARESINLWDGTM